MGGISVMNNTPKSLRLHIAIFGRTNVGKSTFLNMLSGQDVSITSPLPGTTTDVVEKTMELLPIGPVVFLDTAGLDDRSELGALRIKKTRQVFDRADIVVLLVEPNIWEEYEETVVSECKMRQIPLIVVINKLDVRAPSREFLLRFEEMGIKFMQVSCLDTESRDSYIGLFKELLIQVCPADLFRTPSLIGDLLPPGGVAVLVVPIDLQAPKGRLILPQVQTIRDALDNDAACLVVKEREYPYLLSCLAQPPDIVVCDSQVVLKMVADTPDNVKCTTFSILFARYKGELSELVRGVLKIDELRQTDKVLIAEACSHHAIEDDIGRVKIPRWLRQYLGFDVKIDVYSGKDYPDNLEEYKLVIHCGGCMLTRRQMLFRLQKAIDRGVAVTNYGICISFLQGVLERVLSPFPYALSIYKDTRNSPELYNRGSMI